MKIIESSPDRLVARQGVLANYLIAGVLVIGGLAIVAAGSKGDVKFLLVGGVMVAIGALMAVMSRKEDLVADKASGQVNVTATGLLGAKQAVYGFADIASVLTVSQLQTVSTPGNTRSGTGISFGTGGVGLSGGNTQTEKVSETQLLLKNGQTVTIERSTRRVMNGGLFSTGQTGGQLGAALAAVVGVPFNDQEPGTLGDVISAVKQAVTGSFVAGSPAEAPGEASAAPVPAPEARPGTGPDSPAPPPQ